jgi:type II secretory pathway pseudopilin PulG
MSTDPEQPTPEKSQPSNEIPRRKVDSAWGMLRRLMTRRIWPGFNLLELGIVVGIMGLLAAWVMPEYADYPARARAHAALDELNSLKAAVEECAKKGRSLIGCSQANVGVPSAPHPDRYKYLYPAVTVEDGVIRAQARSLYSDKVDVILTPTLNHDQTISWAISGEICVERRYRIACGVR